jgi:hypothetical protein
MEPSLMNHAGFEDIHVGFEGIMPVLEKSFRYSINHANFAHNHARLSNVLYLVIKKDPSHRRVFRLYHFKGIKYFSISFSEIIILVDKSLVRKINSLMPIYSDSAIK